MLAQRQLGMRHTELLLNDLQNLLLVKLLGETLDGSQGLSSISLCESPVSMAVRYGGDSVPTTSREGGENCWSGNESLGRGDVRWIRIWI